MILMGECGLGKSTILKYVIPAIFHTKLNKVLNCIPAKELGQIDRDEKPFIVIDDLGTESIKNDLGFIIRLNKGANFFKGPNKIFAKIKS